MDGRFLEIINFCLSLTNGATRVPEAERQLFGAWSTFVHLFRMPEVQTAAITALDDVADFMIAVVADAVVPSVDDDPENDWNDENRVGGIVQGLARRAASDCQAISALVEHGHVRQAAALCRSLYEAMGWMDLLLDGEAGEKAAALYEFFNTEAGFDAQIDVMRHRAAMMDIARAVLKEEDVVPLLPSILSQQAAVYEESVKAEVRRLKDALPPGVRGKLKNPPKCLLRVAEYFDAARALRYTSLWSATIYFPSCRILHAADALDYVDLHEFGGVIGEVKPDSLPAAVGTPEGILAATVFRTILSLPTVYEWMKDFYWEEEEEDEEARADLRQTSAAMAVVAVAIERYVGPVVEAKRSR